jgi:hypothetical protein
MIVLDENRFLSSSEEGIKDLTTLLLRDRNHPSVFMWCLENEEWIQGTVTGTRILETLTEITHKIDPTRPVTAAMNHGRNEGGYAEVQDVVGYNYGDKKRAYVKDHEHYPDRIIFSTEDTSYKAMCQASVYGNPIGDHCLAKIGPTLLIIRTLVVCLFGQGLIIGVNLHHIGGLALVLILGLWTSVTSRKMDIMPTKPPGKILRWYTSSLIGTGQGKKVTASRFTVTPIAKKLSCFIMVKA